MHYEVISHIKQGDKQAFKYVFDQYFNALCSFGHRYISDLFIIEDLIQEAFISFWEKRQDFEHINAVKAFLYTSVRNKCLNHIKHQSVIKKHQSALIYELESEQHFTANIIEEETFNQLHNEIRNLPKAAQQIMLLALNGLKNQEIADELNISINTVKTQKKISYAALKDKIGPLLSVFLFGF